MTSREQATVLIAAGGTGGHVFPGLAVADILRDEGVSVVWIGTPKGLESTLVPKAGITMEWVSISGLRGKGISTLLVAPFKLAAACWQALAIIRKYRPQVLLGMGGFVAGPAGLMARVAGCPLVVHEQNAIAGLTNRVLSRVATRVLQAFPNAFPSHLDAKVVGNPVRNTIELDAPSVRHVGERGALRLLVIGGSQGAKRLNEVVPAALKELDQPIAVWHQAGGNKLEVTREHYAGIDGDIRISAFIDDMPAAYAWADVVLCRSGAMTVAELAMAGVASLLVPFPAAVDDHQTANARYLVDAGAAKLLPQETLTPASLADTLRELMADKEILIQMAENARQQAQPDAARIVAQVIQEVSV